MFKLQVLLLLLSFTYANAAHDGDYHNQALMLINHYREAHHAPPLQMEKLANIVAFICAQIMDMTGGYCDDIVAFMQHEMQSLPCYFKYRPAGPSVVQTVTAAIRTDYKTGLQQYDFSHPLLSYKKTGCFGRHLWKSASKFGIGAFTNPLTNLTTVITIVFPANITATDFFGDELISRNVLPLGN